MPALRARLSEGLRKNTTIRWRPYRCEYTGSLQNSEVNRSRARIVLRWGTAREVLRVLLALFISVDRLLSAAAARCLGSEEKCRWQKGTACSKPRVGTLSQNGYGAVGGMHVSISVPAGHRGMTFMRVARWVFPQGS